MSSSFAWLGPSLLTLGGALVGALAPTLLRVLDRRTERRRLSRAEKLEDYPGLARVTGRLTRLAVWPVDAGDPREVCEEIEAFAVRIEFASPAVVSEKAAAVLDAARLLADVVVDIRAGSRPAHRQTLDHVSEQRHRDAVGAVNSALDAFVEAGRRDLEASGHYVPARRDLRPEEPGS